MVSTVEWVDKLQMIEKPEIVFTFPACMGGVASFNYNIINYSKLIKKFHSKVILLKAKEDTRVAFVDKFTADEVIVFHYSFKENQYYVQKRLNEIIGNDEGAIVTDNALTIQAATRFNNSKTVFHLIHDYFYVKQNIECGNLVDTALAHSSFFSDAVFAADPSNFAGRSFYIPYGVRQLPSFPEKKKGNLNLVFLGRLDDGKGVLYLHEINKLLVAKSIAISWTIIGKGPLKDKLLQQWIEENNVRFCEPDSTESVYTLLTYQDIFVFPTSFEGTPVSILECLANGIVTVVNDLPGGIRDIVIQDIGFRCRLNNIEDFTNAIVKLDTDRKLLAQMQVNSFRKALHHYDIENNADEYFKCFENYKQLKRTNKVEAPRMSKLDKKYIPNSIVKLIRAIL